MFFCSVGDVIPPLDDLVEIGIDIPHPIRTSTGKMPDLLRLRRRYGNDLCSCGPIDTPHVLPRGTPAEVREGFRRVIRLRGLGGEYLAAPVPSVMDDVLPEDGVAPAEAVMTYGRHPPPSG